MDITVKSYTVSGTANKISFSPSELSTMEPLLLAAYGTGGYEAQTSMYDFTTKTSHVGVSGVTTSGNTITVTRTNSATTAITYTVLLALKGKSLNLSFGSPNNMVENFTISTDVNQTVNLSKQPNSYIIVTGTNSTYIGQQVLGAWRADIGIFYSACNKGTAASSAWDTILSVNGKAIIIRSGHYSSIQVYYDTKE